MNRSFSVRKPEVSVLMSVIMACHNSSAYLDEAVDSILAQTLSDLELILIDDCSTDKSLEIAKSYQRQDNRVWVLSLPKTSGPAIARNAGIRVARGEWLGILDSDDVATPSRFEEQMKLADGDKGLVMIGSSSISIDEKGHVIKDHQYPTSHRDLVKRLFSSRGFPPHSSMVYRRDVVQDLSGFNPRYVQSEDTDLWCRLSEIGTASSVDKKLVKIRIHAHNISNSEAGMQQIRFGFAAKVCHFLRIYRCPDPSAADDEEEWLEFVAWVNRQLIEEGVYERRKAWADARAEYFATKNRLTRAFRFGTHLVQSGHANALLWGKVFGTSLPEHLSRKWMRRSRRAS